jgi:hypothetical protein
MAHPFVRLCQLQPPIGEAYDKAKNIQLNLERQITAHRLEGTPAETDVLNPWKKHIDQIERLVQVRLPFELNMFDRYLERTYKLGHTNSHFDTNMALHALVVAYQAHFPKNDHVSLIRKEVEILAKEFKIAVVSGDSYHGDLTVSTQTVALNAEHLFNTYRSVLGEAYRGEKTTRDVRSVSAPSSRVKRVAGIYG